MNLVEQFNHVFYPRSVAVVGASSSPSKQGYLCLANLLEGGYKGRVYPINPTMEEAFGLKAYPSVRAVPDDAGRAVSLLDFDLMVFDLTVFGNTGGGRDATAAEAEAGEGGDGGCGGGGYGRGELVQPGGEGFDNVDSSMLEALLNTKAVELPGALEGVSSAALLEALQAHLEQIPRTATKQKAIARRLAELGGG